MGLGSSTIHYDGDQITDQSWGSFVVLVGVVGEEGERWKILHCCWNFTEQISPPLFHPCWCYWNLLITVHWMLCNVISLSCLSVGRLSQVTYINLNANEVFQSLYSRKKSTFTSALLTQYRKRRVHRSAKHNKQFIANIIAHLCK